MSRPHYSSSVGPPPPAAPPWHCRPAVCVQGGGGGAGTSALCFRQGVKAAISSPLTRGRTTRPLSSPRHSARRWATHLFRAPIVVGTNDHTKQVATKATRYPKPALPSPPHSYISCYGIYIAGIRYFHFTVSLSALPLARLLRSVSSEGRQDVGPIHALPRLQLTIILYRFLLLGPK